MRTLFTVPTANGQRASIALEEGGLDYEARVVDLYDGQHRSEEMLRLNPFGRMPVLQITDSRGAARTIYGSMAIGMYAAETSGRLLPEDTAASDFYHWTGIIMTDLAPALAGQFYLGTLAPEPFTWGEDFYTEIIRRFLHGIDDHLADNEYMLGRVYTLVDVLLYPSAATSVARMPDGLRPYPNIARWAGLLGEREAVVRGIQVSS